MTLKYKINNLVLENSKYDEVKNLIEENKEIKFILSREYYFKKNDSYPFNYFIIDDFKTVEALIKTNNNFFEILQFNKPLKPFFDIDFKLDEYKINVEEYKNKILDNIIDEIKNIFVVCFNIKLDSHDIIILDGQRSDKLSWHIIINNNYYFINIQQHKEFIYYMQSKNIILKYFDIALNNILDCSIYTKNRNFRLINQCKIKYNDKPFNIISNHSIKDTLIIDYFDNAKNILDCSFVIQFKKIQDNEAKREAVESKINNISYFNIDKNELNNILLQIPKKYFKEYDTWHKIAASIRNINYDFYDLLDYYSRGHGKYNEIHNREIYENDLKNLNNSWGYLVSLLPEKRLNKQIKNNLIKDYLKFDAPEIPQDIKIITDENRYINHELLINATEKHIILDALMDKGKTQAIKKLINHMKGKNKELITKNNVNIKINEKKEQLKKYKADQKDNNFIIFEDNLKHYEEELNKIEINTTEYNDMQTKINNYKNDYENYNNTILNFDDEILELFKLKNKLFSRESKQNLKENKIKILILSSRITFSRHMSKEFEIMNYLDVPDNNLNDFNDSIIISIESLYKLNSEIKFDFIILDEIESLLNQFNSNTCKNKNNCFKKLLDFIKSTNKIIYADAFITSRTIKFLNNFNESKLIINNPKYENNKKAFVYNDESLLINKMLDDLKEGKKIYAHFTSCNKGVSILKQILEQNILKEEETIFYSSIESMKEGAELSNNELLLDINVHWAELKYISSTSSITVGNSYIKTDVDNVYIFGGFSILGGCCVRDSFQNHMRIRNNQGNLYCYIPPEKKTFKPELLNIFEHSKNKDDYINELQKFNYFLQNLEETEIFYLLKYEKIEDNNLKTFLHDSINYEYIDNYKTYMQFKYNAKEKNDIMKKYFKVCSQYNNFVKNYNSSLDEIIKINSFEHNINIYLYNYIFFEYLKKMSYNIEYINIELPTKINNQKEFTDYENIENIDDDVLKQHITSQRLGKITRKMNDEKNKAFFKKYFQNENDERLENIYNSIYATSKEKHNNFNNIRLEYNFYNNKNKFKSDLTNNYEKIKNDQSERSLNYNKFFEIVKINKVFNIEGSYNNIILDSSTLVKKFQKYILLPNKIKTIKYLFNVDYNINLKDDLKHNRTAISKIYNSFNGSTLMNNEEKRTAKERTILNYKFENIFNKSINKDFNIDNLFKIYTDFNKFDVEFID